MDVNALINKLTEMVADDPNVGNMSVWVNLPKNYPQVNSVEVKTIPWIVKKENGKTETLETADICVIK